MKSLTNPLVSIAAPAFNEAECLRSVITAWANFFREHGISGEIVICNDGSTDGTKIVLETLSSELPMLRTIHFENNTGYGNALSCAMDACNGTYILTMDSDGQSDISSLSEMLRIAQEQDLDAVLGCRIKKADNFLPVFADKCLRIAVWLLFFAHVKDPNCSMKLVRSDILHKFKLESCGYSLASELVIKLLVHNAKVMDYSTQNFKRKAGKSALNIPKVSLSTLYFFIYLRVSLFLFKHNIIKSF